MPKIMTVLKNGYTKQDLKSDALAGLTVSIVALPLAMALAIASGTSPDKGLITAVIAGFLTSFLGGSRVQIGGPTGAFVVVISNIITHHGYDGLVMATLMAGVILIISGYTKLGEMIKFIPNPVVTGFTAGIAVIIASSQVKDFFGLEIEKIPADFMPKWESYFDAAKTFHLTTFLVGLSVLCVIILLRRFTPRYPAYLIAIGIASGIVTLFHIPVDTIGSRFPVMPFGLPLPELPHWDLMKAKDVMPSAFTIAFLAGIEALLSAVVADGMTGYKHRSNQELVGQGIANIAAALFGGLPATGAIARTATNIKAGAKTPMAGMFHAVFILVFMFFGHDLMGYVPMAALAAILFVVAWGMSEITQFIHIFRILPSDRNIMVLTFFLTILVDLTVAIAVGVTLASLLFMKHMTQSVEIKSEGGHLTDLYENEEETQRQKLPNGVEVFRITGPVFFGIAHELLETLKFTGPIPRVLILRLRMVPYLDATGVAVIAHMIKKFHGIGTKIILSGTQPQPEKILNNSHVQHRKDGVFFSPDYVTSIKIAQEIMATKT